LPRDKVLALATGSQGEPRAALARMAEDQHSSATLSAGDRVIFSSRTIPGNERAVGRVINGLVEQYVDVVTDRTHLVHVSGHPRRAELARMYEWTKPKIAIPAHGEPLHLSVHVAFAKAQGVGEVARAYDGDMVAIEAGRAGLIDRVQVGRRYKDGEILLPTGAECVAERRRLSVSGIVSVALAISDKGDLVGDPDVLISGLPERTRDGAGFDAIIDSAIFETLDGLPRGKRRDADFVSGAVERAVRNSVNSAWGKRPTVHVLVVEI
jgi:ribonuclease J